MTRCRCGVWTNLGLQCSRCLDREELFSYNRVEYVEWGDAPPDQDDDPDEDDLEDSEDN